MSGWTASWVLVWGLQHVACTPPAPERSPVESALGLLQYVAGDYAAAVVEDGRVADAFEHAEQVELLARVESTLHQARAPRRLRARAAELRTAAAAARPPAGVVPGVRALHADIVAHYGIELAPRTVPSLVAGRLLYEQSYRECHGADGNAATERARNLRPPPSDFLAPELGQRLSPYHVYNIVTFGVPGTAMASFETLEEFERWDLAFYVVSLRHAAAAPGAAPPLPLRELARSTDDDLLRRLVHLDAEARAAQLAAWRRWLPTHVGD